MNINVAGTTITDSRTITLLKQWQGQQQLSDAEKQELYNLLKDNTFSVTDISVTFVYQENGQNFTVAVMPSTFEALNIAAAEEQSAVQQQQTEPALGEDYRGKQPTEEQKAAAAAQNTVLTVVERTMPNAQAPSITGEGNNVISSEADMAEWLLLAFNEACRKDSKTPQIPVSICASVALARGGNNALTLKKYNFWQLPYDKALTNLDNDDGYCAFGNEKQGVQAVLNALHTYDKLQPAIAKLKEKMADSTDEDKDEATRIICLALDPDNATGFQETVLKLCKKYKMREWDTDKTEAEGGHADTKKSSSDTAKKTEAAMAKAVQRIEQKLSEKGYGVKIEPLGGDYSRVIKLPYDTTLCEPIYPDLVTVGDTVPDWVFSETYAQQAKEAEEAALKAAGLIINSEEELQLSYVNQKLEAFKEQQFVAWCLKNNVTYTSDTEKQEALQKYKEAAAADPENFTDDVWTPDSTTKTVYKGLLTEKASLRFNGDTATANAHLRYLEAAAAAGQQISDREGNWNQNTGGTYSAVTGQPVEDASFTQGSASSTTTPSSAAEPEEEQQISVDSKIEAAVSWAEQQEGKAYASIDTDGIFASKRDGPDAYDCSSLVYWALQNAGFDIKSAWEKNSRYSAAISEDGYEGKQVMGDADTIWQDIQTMGSEGWTKYNFGSVTPQRGDILYRHNTHCAFAKSSSKTIEAKGKDYGIGSWDIGSNWTEIYRYTGR